VKNVRSVIKCCVVFSLLFFSLHGTELSSALGLLKAKLLNLAKQLEQESKKEQSPYATYEDIKDWTKEQLEAFHDFYFDEITCDKSVEKLQEDLAKGIYHIQQLPSLIQNKTLCGYFSAFNGSEMYKKAITKDGDASQVDLTREADTISLTQKEKNLLGTMYSKLDKPYDTYDPNKPKEFDVWIARRILDLGAIKNSPQSLFNIPRLDSVCVNKKLSSVWLYTDEVFWLSILSLKLFEECNKEKGWNFLLVSFFPHVSGATKGYSDEKEFTINFSSQLKWVREFRRTGNPILIPINQNGVFWCVCIMTKKGVFIADSHAGRQNLMGDNDYKVRFQELYKCFVGAKDEKLSLKSTSKSDVLADAFNPLFKSDRQNFLEEFLRNINIRKVNLENFKKTKPEFFSKK
jgi:hypothetical protein